MKPASEKQLREDIDHILNQELSGDLHGRYGFARFLTATQIMHLRPLKQRLADRLVECFRGYRAGEER